MVLGQAGAEKHSKQRANTMKPMAIEFMIANPLRKPATDSHYNLAGRTNIDRCDPADHLPFILLRRQI